MLLRYLFLINFIIIKYFYDNPKEMSDLYFILNNGAINESNYDQYYEFNQLMQMCTICLNDIGVILLCWLYLFNYVIYLMILLIQVIYKKLKIALLAGDI